MRRLSLSASSYQEDVLGPLDPSTLKGLQILVVEDDPDISALFAFVLEEMGATVSVAGSASAAMSALEDDSFDLLISDIGLPDTDGNAFLHHVRTLDVKSKKQIPAIAITGFVDEKTHSRIWETGYQRLLIKPICLDKFVTTVAEVVGRSPDELASFVVDRRPV